MRPLYVFAGLVALGISLVGWAALGQAGPDSTLPPPPPTDPVPGELPPAVSTPGLRPIPKPRPADELFDIPSPPTSPKPEPAKPTGRSGPPVRVLEVPDVPDVPRPQPIRRAPDAPAPTRETPPRTGLKPTVFIPNPEASEPPKMAESPKIVPAAATGALARQEPAISLEWHGPPTLQVNAPAEYKLVARNTSAIPLQKVTLQVRIPSTARLLGTEPKSDGTESVLVWEFGTLTAGQEKVVKLNLVPPGKGELHCQAWVTFTGSAIMKAQVREARLAMAAKAPPKVAIGDLATLVFQVNNTGDHAAEGVKLAVSLGAGLECERGPNVVLNLDTIAAGESREVKVPCVARTAGVQRCEAVAEGANGLTAKTTAVVSVVEPKLDLRVSGPKLRYLDRKAVYALTVSNTGDSPATGVVATHQVPSGFRYVAASDGGKYVAAAGTVTWDVGDIGPGQAKELKCELLATGLGEFVQKFSATGERGLRAQSNVATKVEGLSAVAMEVTDSDDPVEVGSDTTYEIRVANTGSKDETDIKLVCAIPAQMAFKAARGPGKFELVGGDVVFEVLRKLPARTEITYKVTVTAKKKGDARFKATLTAGDLTEPVIKQESTRVYSD